MNTALLLATLLLLGSDIPDRQMVIAVVGAPGTDEYGSQFLEWSGRWQAAAKQADADFISIGTDESGDVWVAHQKNNPPFHYGKTVGHLRASGAFVDNVLLDPDPNPHTGVGPTGLSVDSNGKVWVGCFDSNCVMRIDPVLGTAGEVDLVVPLGTAATHPSGLDAQPYNYSDMTGFNNHIVNTHPVLKPYKGYWMVVDDSGNLGMVWETVSWVRPVPNTGRIEVHVRAAESRTGLYSQEFVAVPDTGVVPAGVIGRFLEVRVALIRDDLAHNPILNELKVCGHTTTLLITEQPGNQIVPEGGTATFIITASGTDPLSFQWYHDDSPLSDGPWVSGANSATLTIHDVHCLNGGAYWVLVQDASGTTLESTKAFLVMDARTIVFYNAGSGTYPYPATINVSGLPTGIGQVTVTLNVLYHLNGYGQPKPADLGILLEDPEGQTVMLMSHAGGNSPVPEQAGVTLTFDDLAQSQIPDWYIASGIYQPSPYQPVPTMPWPAPAPGYGTGLSTFNGPARNPNGVWKLYVWDFGGGDPSVGQIQGSWCLTISPFTP